MRVLRVISALQENDGYVKNKIKEGIGMERIVLFLLSLILLFHLSTCLWILSMTFREEYHDIWVVAEDGELSFEDQWELYITSYYFIVTSITTVGYGDLKSLT